MSNPVQYTLTNDSVTVIFGGKPHVVRRGQPNFENLRNAVIAENWAAVPGHLTVGQSVLQWLRPTGFESYNEFYNYSIDIESDEIRFNGKPIPLALQQRVTAMATAGEDPLPVLRFWERLQNNPSRRSVEQLWNFLQQQGIPLTAEGKFLAYKGVRDDYLDQHSGQFDNSPGNVHEMPRNEISDDPKEACHEGFHVGALEYARGFGSRVVICEVDPEDVVCVPYDSSYQKMRVSRYRVVGNWNGEYLPSTSTNGDDFEVIDEDDTGATDVDVDAESLQDEVDALVSNIQVTPFKVAKKWARLQSMGYQELLDVPLDRLRTYASRGLKIIGASRIPGGKVALINRIIRTRGF